VNMDVQWLPEGAVSTGIASAAFGTVKSKHRRP